jgi:hypothetical protein
MYLPEKKEANPMVVFHSGLEPARSHFYAHMMNEMTLFDHLLSSDLRVAVVKTKADPLQREDPTKRYLAAMSTLHG